jgi:alpha-tubulin suppressor-like RCC1 family protein
MYGQLGDGTFTNRYSPVIVNTQGALSNVNITSMALGDTFSILLSSSGAFYSFGYTGNTKNLLGTSYSKIISSPSYADTSTPHSDLSSLLSSMTARKVVVGNMFTAALLNNGTLVTFGDNSVSQLAQGFDGNFMPYPKVSVGSINNRTITDIAAGDLHLIALCSDNTIWTAGKNAQGQLGQSGAVSTLNTFQQMNMSYSYNFSRVFGGLGFSAALSRDGYVVMWGSNAYGQLAQSAAVTQNSVPTLVTFTSIKVVDICVGSSHVIALGSDGLLYSWGRNNKGQLGVNSTQSQLYTQTQVIMTALSGKNVSSISCGADHSAILTTDSEVYMFGSNQYGQFGNGIVSASSQAIPLRIAALSGLGITNITCGRYVTFLRNKYGITYAMGYNTDGNLGTGDVLARLNATILPQFSDPTFSYDAVATMIENDHAAVLGCSLPYCYGILKSNTTFVCSGKGSCDSTNVCLCDAGYFGAQCQNYSCYNIHFGSSGVCSGQGSCIAPDTCICNSNYVGNNCELSLCFG